MNRKETTDFLSRLLIKNRFSGTGKYWASEVVLDYGKSELKDDHWESKTRRIDFLQFVPKNQLSASGIEKGVFICYEVKSSKADFLSGYGQNFIGEKNYLVMTMNTYKALKECGETDKIPHYVGILVPMPYYKKFYSDKFETEYRNPTGYLPDVPIEQACLGGVYLETVKPAKERNRERSMTELLFCMLRSNCKEKV